MFNCNYLELSKENVFRNTCCHIDHTLLESYSWYGSTKFLNWFLKQLSCRRNICTKYGRKLPNLTAFFDIYLYLQSRNNGNFVKTIKSFVKFAINLFQPMHICQIPHVIFESTSHFSFKFCINLQCHQT